MKLALVTETFPPEVNGVSMTLGRLVAGLSTRGFDVQVVRPSQGRDSETQATAMSGISELLVAGLPLPGYDGLRMGQPCAYRLLFEWNQTPPDVVHVATEGPLGLAALWVASMLGIPASSTYHTNFHQYTGHYHIGLIRDFILVFLRIAHNACGCTLAPTKQMASELRSLGFKNTGVLSRGVDTKLYSPDRRDASLRSEWGATEESIVFAFVGRVASEKNIDLAIASFRQAARAAADSILVIVGDGPERKRLETENPDIVFAGMRKGEDLARHYASSDVFLFPSITETFGNVVTEAMSSGLAVVTFDYAAGRELIIDGENGYLAKYGNSTGFQKRAMEIAKMGLEKLAGVRSQARETALSVNWDKVIEDFKRSLELVENRDREMYSKIV